MPLRHHRLLAALAAVAALALGIRAWMRPEPVAVSVAAVTTGAVEETVANTRAGTVKACRRARMAPVVAGQIARLPVHRGDRVEAGQLLLELWNADRRAQVGVAEAELRAARARSREACVAAELAAREAKRVDALHARRLASEEAAEKARADSRAREASCAASQASVGVSEARLQAARAALERTRLRAPFAGVVAELHGELGEVITPSPIGVATLPAVDLIDDGCSYVEAPIDEVDAPRLRRDLPVRIALDAFGQRRFPGRIRRIAAYVLDRERQARTVAVEVDFAEPPADVRLLPGYSADVEIVLRRREHVLRIPTEAVREGDRVLVLEPASGRLVERRIETGISNWEYTEVRSGLQPGERVVTSVDREGVAPGVRARAETPGQAGAAGT